MGINFACQEHLVAPARDRFADQLLSPALAIHLSGINQGRTKIETEPERFDFFNAGPTVLAHVPSPLTESRYALTGWQCDCPHADLHFLQILFHKLHRYPPFADSRGNAFCPTRSNVSGADDSSAAGQLRHVAGEFSGPLNRDGL
jgi:hypothetical protein